MEVAVRIGFDDREADVGEIRNRLPIDLAVATARLCPALDDVTCYGSGCKFVPLFGTPSELVDRRRQSQRGVGRAPRDNHLSSGFKRFDQGKRSQVDVGTQNLWTDRLDRLAAVDIVEGNAPIKHFVHSFIDVVTQDDRHFAAFDARSSRGVDDCSGTGPRVDPAGIRDDPDISLHESRKNAGREGNKVAGISLGRVALFLLL